MWRKDYGRGCFYLIAEACNNYYRIIFVSFLNFGRYETRNKKYP